MTYYIPIIKTIMGYKILLIIGYNIITCDKPL